MSLAGVDAACMLSLVKRSVAGTAAVVWSLMPIRAMWNYHGITCACDETAHALFVPQRAAAACSRDMAVPCISVVGSCDPMHVTDGKARWQHLVVGLHPS